MVPCCQCFGSAPLRIGFRVGHESSACNSMLACPGVPRGLRYTTSGISGGAILWIMVCIVCRADPAHHASVAVDGFFEPFEVVHVVFTAVS